MAFINCTLNDNILVFDENRTIVLDYCKVKEVKKIVMVSKQTKNVFIEYNYGSNSFFTVAFDWFVLPASNITAVPSGNLLNTVI
jgi:hypothetical protein